MQNLFIKEVDKNALITIDGKRLKSVDSIETYGHGANEKITYKKQEVKCNNMIKQYKND